MSTLKPFADISDDTKAKQRVYEIYGKNCTVIDNPNPYGSWDVMINGYKCELEWHNNKYPYMNIVERKSTKLYTDEVCDQPDLFMYFYDGGNHFITFSRGTALCYSTVNIIRTAQTNYKREVVLTVEKGLVTTDGFPTPFQYPSGYVKVYDTFAYFCATLKMADSEEPNLRNGCYDSIPMLVSHNFNNPQVQDTVEKYFKKSSKI